MDPGGWCEVEDPERIIDRIVELAIGRAQQGRRPSGPTHEHRLNLSSVLVDAQRCVAGHPVRSYRPVTALDTRR